jgi:methionyl-tRNA formyltransferase/L-amino acid N-acyltransferase YncA
MRILLCGDTAGIRQLLRHVPCESIVGIIAASIRPQYLQELGFIADANKIPLLVQPKWKSDDYENFHQQIISLKPDLILVNSYSMIIRGDILSASRLGGLNIHAALLPHNRGCNPTQWAIIHHEYETGVTLHEIDSGLDTGPIIDQRKVPIFFEDTWLDVRDRLEQATDALLSDNLSAILSENWSAKSQLHRQASVGRRRTPEDGRFTWSESVVDIHNKIRALVLPLPPAHYYTLDDERVEISEYRTPWQVTLDKYSSDLGGVMRSERVRLRPLQKTDAPLLYEWITDRELVIHNAPYFPVSESDHESWIERMMTKRSDLVIFVIEETVSEKAIGTCQLLNINWIHRSAELQIRIGDSANQGKGYGTEAVRLLCEFGFTDLNLHRIYLHVFAANRRAIRAYEKCHFKREGTLEKAAFINGSFIDVVLMAKISIESYENF